jgi:rhodanese-related sulfurtransferase
MDRLGIGNDTLVVLYGGNNNWFAAYAYWYFRYYGHGPVRLMDGGRKKWELEKRRLTSEPSPVKSKSGYRTGGPAEGIRAMRKFVEDKVVGHSDYALVDVRSPEEYRGELLAPEHLPQEQAQRPGHLPAARNIPWAKAVDPETGAFLPLPELRALYEGHGVTPDREVVAYCRIGEHSAHTWFVLHELLAYPRVRNYVVTPGKGPRSCHRRGRQHAAGTRSSGIAWDTAITRSRRWRSGSPGAFRCTRVIVDLERFRHRALGLGHPAQVEADPVPGRAPATIESTSRSPGSRRPTP